MNNICPTCDTSYDCVKQGKTRRGENYCSLACADDMDGNVTLFPSDLCRSVPCLSMAASTWLALTKACGVSSKPSVVELRMMAANAGVLTSREFRWLEIRATLEDFADIGGVDVSFLHNVGSTDAEQAAFEEWLESDRPSGDAESIRRQWESRWCAIRQREAAGIADEKPGG